MRTTISVLMPVFNAAPYLAEAIESILNQSFENFEFIIVDDCSTDHSVEIIKKFAKLDSRIIFHRNEANLGIAGNRNRCVRLATSKYVAWQDADDISLRHRLYQQLNFLDANPGVAIVGGAMEIFGSNETVSYRKYPLCDAEIRRNIYKYSTIAQPTAMILRASLIDVGDYDLRYPPSEDLDMTFRLGRKWRLANLDSILIKYRVNQNSVTQKSTRKMEIKSSIIRFSNLRNPAFGASIFDIIFCAIHFISIWLVPSRIKIRLFNAWRNRGST